MNFHCFAVVCTLHSPRNQTPTLRQSLAAHLNRGAVVVTHAHLNNQPIITTSAGGKPCCGTIIRLRHLSRGKSSMLWPNQSHLTSAVMFLVVHSNVCQATNKHTHVSIRHRWLVNVTPFGCLSMNTGSVTKGAFCLSWCQIYF